MSVLKLDIFKEYMYFIYFYQINRCTQKKRIKYAHIEMYTLYTCTRLREYAPVKAAMTQISLGTSSSSWRKNCLKTRRNACVSKSCYPSGWSNAISLPYYLTFHSNDHQTRSIVIRIYFARNETQNGVTEILCDTPV